jgi:hypothetical protein
MIEGVILKKIPNKKYSVWTLSYHRATNPLKSFLGFAK